jgi:hypothetical protein
MKVALVDVDRTADPENKIIKGNFPNLALMKLSAYHKSKGDEVKLYDPLFDKPDMAYASKVFTFTPDLLYCPDCEVQKAGSGYSNNIEISSAFGVNTFLPYMKLPEEMESICPDYGLYGTDYSIGFLTRGCIRRCWWCSVWRREGKIRPAADIEQFLKHGHALLLDNNVLAHEWGIRQIEKIARLGVKVDFNQGLDARLIDNSVAKLLAKVNWWQPVRLACDSSEMMPIVQKAVETLRWHNVTPRRYSCYVLITKDIENAVERIRFLRGLDVDPFGQAFISDTEKPNKQQKKLARFTNNKKVLKSTTWEEYQYREEG